MTKQIENRKTFFDRLQSHFSNEDISLIEFAYDLSKEAHRAQKRDQGERYFEHPRAGCIIMMDELHLYDRDLLIAFLFHDVGEDTPLLGNRTDSYDKFVAQATFRLTKVFGERVADIVIRLTKPEVDEARFKTKSEAFRYYIHELGENTEAILLKMVDRLHNLRCLSTAEPTKILRQISETEGVYLPLFRSFNGKYVQHETVLIEKIEEALAELKTNA